MSAGRQLQAHLKRSVFIQRNAKSDGARWESSSSEFHNMGATTDKALQSGPTHWIYPTSDTWSRASPEEHRAREGSADKDDSSNILVPSYTMDMFQVPRQNNAKVIGTDGRQGNAHPQHPVFLTNLCHSQAGTLHIDASFPLQKACHLTFSGCCSPPHFLLLALKDDDQLSPFPLPARRWKGWQQAAVGSWDTGRCWDKGRGNIPPVCLSEHLPNFLCNK